jgi:hypothetical protein
MTVLSTKEFLQAVVTGDKGYFCFAIGNNETNWKEIWYEWPKDIDAIVEAATAFSDETNVYFSTYLFKNRSTTKDNVLPTRTIQADLDEADINNLPVPPTVLVQTSPGRHQGYWLLTEPCDSDIHEVLSRKLTYAIPLCDHSGWPLGRKVRIANTYNYKYLDGRKPVTVVAYANRKYEPGHLELLPDAPSMAHEEINVSFLDNPTPLDTGPYELLETIKSKIPAEVYTSYGIVAPDRSLALWKLMCAAFRADLTRDQVYWLARESANNKFASLKYNGDRELAKDVLRAESVVKSGIVDTRDLIEKARKLNGSQHDKRQHILDIVADMMEIQGRFIRTFDNNSFYIRTDVGRPILMSQRSEYLLSLLDMEFGLNPTEPETKFVAAGLCNKVLGLPQVGATGALSYFDDSNDAMLVHTGHKDVIRVTRGSIQTVTDGAYNFIFPWAHSFEHFKLDYTSLDKPWEEVLYGDTADNVTNMNRDEALATLKVWTMFLFFRSIATSRPILALFGQPGSGKSTTFRKLYAFLYGKNRSLGAVTTPEDFDYATSNDPLVVLDNVDSWERWLPDRLALAAATSDITKRKLYTDFDTITLTRQSLIAVTAHSPKFGREDVTDRLLILNLKRLEHFRAEGPIVDEVAKLRPQIYGAIVRDIQRILAHPEPSAHELPQIRVEDFARIGYWIACALNCAPQFKSAVETLRSGQKTFVLEEEYILVDAIKHMITRDVKNNEVYKWRTAGALWTALEVHSDTTVFKDLYKNSATLAKKVWALYDALKAMFDVEFQYDTNLGQRLWRFKDRGTS